MEGQITKQPPTPQPAEQPQSYFSRLNWKYVSIGLAVVLVVGFGAFWIGRNFNNIEKISSKNAIDNTSYLTGNEYVKRVTYPQDIETAYKAVLNAKQYKSLSDSKLIGLSCSGYYRRDMNSEGSKFILNHTESVEFQDNEFLSILPADEDRVNGKYIHGFNKCKTETNLSFFILQKSEGGGGGGLQTTLNFFEDNIITKSHDVTNNTQVAAFACPYPLALSDDNVLYALCFGAGNIALININLTSALTDVIKFCRWDFETERHICENDQNSSSSKPGISSWHTYAIDNFSFKLPPSFSLQQPDTGNTAIYLNYIPDPQGGRGYDPSQDAGKLKIDVIKQLKDGYENNKHNNPNGTEITLPQGYKAYRLNSDMGIPYYVQKPGTDLYVQIIFYLDFINQKDLAEEIINTLELK